MKREYIKPQVRAVAINPAALICMSSDFIPVTDETEGDEEIVSPPSNAASIWEGQYKQKRFN